MNQPKALPNPLLNSVRHIGAGLCWLAVYGLLVGQAWQGSADQTLAASSASFQVRDDQVGGNQFTQNSGNYRVHGGVEALVGSQSSGSFQTQTGTPIIIEQPNTPSTPGGGGLSTAPSGCPAPTPLGVTNVRCSRFYKSLFQITGTRDINTPYIFVNESMAGVFLSSTTTWSKDVYLVQGQNTITIYGKNACDATTPPLVIVFTKAKMGDTNDDLATDDYDLSTFTRRWELRDDCISDFNQDKLTNDYDLSLLASAWTG